MGDGYALYFQADQGKAVKLTPWFSMDVAPIYPGVYMVDQSWPDQETEAVYAYWDCVNWYPQGSTPKDAMYTMCYGPTKGRPFKQWRGLAEEPK